jgi:hypothetical protein
VASVLTRKVVNGDTITFEPPTAGPQPLLDGRMIADDKELVTALVNSTNFEFNTCRLAFQFLFGRNELACEGPIFDRCIDAFRSQKKMQAALEAIAGDPSFCR